VEVTKVEAVALRIAAAAVALEAGNIIVIIDQEQVAV